MEHILCIEYPEHFWSKNYVNLFTYMVFFDEPTSIFVQSVAFEGDRRRSTDIWKKKKDLFEFQICWNVRLKK